MKISEIKKHLENLKSIQFKLPNGDFVPYHFHITEVGLITKHYIDCGGTERFEKVANFQLWNADDTIHRLEPHKLLDIITLSEQKIGVGDFEIEVEYQTETIGKYNLTIEDADFVLVNKQTACLAKENCGIPTEKMNTNVTSQSFQTSCCTPNSTCC